MKDQYPWTINSTQDINRALAEADRAGYELTFYTSRFDLRGKPGVPISVDGRLKNLHVIAHGPASVYVEEGATVEALESSVIYVGSGGTVDAYDSATVYAYDDASVSLSMNASAYVSSDDVDVEAYGNSRTYLPSDGTPGSKASVSLNDSASEVVLTPSN